MEVDGVRTNNGHIKTCVDVNMCNRTDACAVRGAMDAASCDPCA